MSSRMYHPVSLVTLECCVSLIRVCGRFVFSLSRKYCCNMLSCILFQLFISHCAPGKEQLNAYCRQMLKLGRLTFTKLIFCARLASVTVWLFPCFSTSYPCWMHDVENNIKCFGVTGCPQGTPPETTLNSKQNCVKTKNGYTTILLHIRTSPSLCESTVVSV
jgi:hypothetical protein